MLKIAIRLLLLGIVVAAAAVSPAQSVGRPGTGAQGHDSRIPKRSMDERMASFAKAMGLNDAQKAKVKAVLLKQFEKQRKLAQNQKLSTQQRSAEVTKLLNETNQLVRAQLTKAQQAKFDKMLADAKKRREANLKQPPAQLKKP